MTPPLLDGVPGGTRTTSLARASAALLLIGALNAFFAARPDLLALPEIGLATGAALVAGAAAATLALTLAPALALITMAVLVVAHASEVLVRFHGLPSLLQLLALPLALAAVVHGRRTIAAGMPWGLLALSGAWVLTLAASSTWAASPELADAIVFEALRGLAILAVVVLLIDDRARLRVAAAATVAAAAAIAAGAVLQGLSGETFGELGGFGRIKHAQIYRDVFDARIAGPFGDPNFFAQILVLTLPLAIAFIALGRRSTTRILAATAGTLILGAIALSYSRGAVLALAAQLVVALFWLRVRHRRAALAGIALALAVALALPTGFAERLATIGEFLPGGEETLDPDSSFAKRRLVTGAAWRMALDNPVLGVGAGNYSVHFDRYAAEVGSADRAYADVGDDQKQYPHNLYLEVAAETGAIGLTVFVALLTVAFFSLRHALRAATGAGELTLLPRALGLGLVGYLVAGLFLHGQFQRPLWWVLGLIGATASLAHRSRS